MIGLYLFKSFEGISFHPPSIIPSTKSPTHIDKFQLLASSGNYKRKNKLVFLFNTCLDNENTEYLV